MRPSVPDFEHVLGRPGEGPRRVVDLGRAEGRAGIVERDRPGRGQDPGATGAGRVAEEGAVVDDGVDGGAAVQEVIVDGREGKGEGKRGESARAEQQEGAGIELRERLHLRRAGREQRRFHNDVQAERVKRGESSRVESSQRARRRWISIPTRYTAGASGGGRGAPSSNSA